ncbi:MAG TPA: tRNA uridine-5-carboxymethylaminomethyl(34) synthesis GTPase MnmE [Candidatus Limivivens intestinipullorum]|uniref:tRNA modification GTPase MnmE n=1 Tax=Candidatus Limivivens intestinipullorum TaxID=2840858 RepID=A0A9D1JK85_9FIRM|nr:tRNA uridine-5-carboxymethylaminomethyl(34) synthesis GTPase MnmE [Candidatus Limivivens intestinipullorum]
MKNDTIAAISTAVSPSGIGIIRISGEEALRIADRIYRSPGGKKKLSAQQTHTIHYGYIMDGEDVVDEVLVSVMRAPKTFTAEDTVEINCHGGVYAMKRVLETVLKNGARPAQAGEFTKRAFLNGRMDLSRAEAVIDIIQAKNEYALKSSVSQLKGSVQKRIKKLREEILYETAYVESALDDPEHISLDGFSGEIGEKNRRWMGELNRLIASADNGKIITEGIRTVILGKPNAGKSSLLNLLLGEERAIVTDVAGTTRDTLEENVNINGLTLRLIDTAGIRRTKDLVEQIGVERAKETAQTADLIIYVVDASVPLDENDRQIMELIRGKKTLVLLNKSDLETVVEKEDIQAILGDSRAAAILTISAREQTDAREIENTIQELFFHGELSFNDEVYITNTRQKAELVEAFESLAQLKNSLDMEMPEDFYTIDLMNAYEALGRITGESVEEDLVNEIFGRFCMGK